MKSFGLVALALSAGVDTWPDGPRPGDGVRVRWAPSADEVASGTASVAVASLMGHEFRFVRSETGAFEGYAALPVEAAPGPTELRIRVGSAEDSTLIEVKARTFRSSQLRVAPKYSNRQRSPELEARIQRERASIRAVWERPPAPLGSDPAWAGLAPLRPFQPVRNRPRITSVYGTKRVFNGELKSRHFGLDLAGRVGHPVFSVLPGQIVLAEDRFYSGGTLVIDHGGGLFTLYFHLSKKAARLGQTVKAGQFIGRVGRSGRVTGPHLHLSVAIQAKQMSSGQVRGLYVDPARLLEGAKLRIVKRKAP